MKTVNSITINPSSVNITEGTWYNDFCVQVLPADAENKCIIWSSKDPSIATVMPELGCVYGNNEGTTTIYAAAQDGSGIVGECSITVVNPICVEDINLSREFPQIDRYGLSYKCNK